MPLLDHFHPPLSERRQWHAFHSVWATMIALDLNRHLPPGYFADPNVEFNIEIDVAAFEDEKPNTDIVSWTPPAPTLTAPMALITDVVEIAVYNSEAGPVLIGAIELVSPSNKDRPETRDAFVSKCASYLQQAIGLIVVDLVTNRKADLHAELLQRVTGLTAPRSELWAAAYRPAASRARRAGRTEALSARYRPAASRGGNGRGKVGLGKTSHRERIRPRHCRTPQLPHLRCYRC